MRHWVRRQLPGLALLLALLAGLSGCASNPGHPNYISEPNLPISGRIDKAPAATTAASLGTDVLAFGRLRWLENSKERTGYRSGWGWNVWLPYFRTQDAQKGLFVVEKDGFFTWRIAKGSYLFNRIGWRDAWDGLHFIDPKVAFEATADAPAHCLGTLVVDLKTRRDLVGMLWIDGLKIRVDDECDALSRQFHARYADPDLAEAKSLMRFDPDLRIPAELEKWNKMQDFWRAITPGLMSSP